MNMDRRMPVAQAAATAFPGRAAGSRITLHQSRYARVENCWISADASTRSGFEIHHQLALTYSGIFTYAVGDNHWFIDTSRTLFTSPGVEYREDHPVPGVGHAALLITPSRLLFEELGLRPGSALDLVFEAVSCPSTLRLRLLVQHFLNLRPDTDNPLVKDEWVVRTVKEAFQVPAPSGSRAPKLVEQTKQLLHERFCERLSLEQIATEIGVSPVYLTQEFKRCEGTPLYRYQLQLRLSRALLDLPHCEDITGLALDLGFSSHSHFTAVFHKGFGLTPSEYRSGIGSRQLLLDDASTFAFDEAGRDAA